MLTYSKTHSVIGAFVVACLLVFSSCQHRIENQVTLSEGENVSCVMLFYDGSKYTQFTSLKSITENEIGKVSGLGSYQLNERVVVKAEVKSDDYILHTLYEKDGKEGFTKTQGLVSESDSSNSYMKIKDTMCQITFHIKSDMMFIAIFSKKDVSNPDLPPLPPLDGPIIIGSVDLQQPVIVGDTINVNANEFN